MALPINTVTKRKHYARAYSNGELVDATMLASVDAQDADLCEAVNQCKARLDAISTSAGSLNYALVSVNSFTATAGQTAFTVTTYDNTAGASFVLAFANGLALAQSAITQTSTTVVTLSAQTLGTAVKIVIFAAGNGTSQLASTSSGEGAALIGINDAGAYLTATTVEGALQEIAANLASSAYIGNVISLSGYLSKAGGTMTGAIAMGSNKITDLAAGTASSNDAARMADITAAALTSTLSSYLAATYLPVAGGTMSGPIAMGSQKITGLAAATANGNAVRYDEFIAHPGTYITSGTIDKDRLPTMTAATASVDGTRGTVPTPVAGDQTKILYGDATWKTPPTTSAMTAASAGSAGTGGLTPAPTAGQQDYVLHGDATWRAVTASIGTGYILLNDTKAYNADGGGSSAGAWTARDLTTEVIDSGNHCAVAANAFTLNAGTYRIRVRSPFYGNVGLAVIRLRNTSDAATVATGTHERCAAAATMVWCHLDYRFTITASKTFQIEYFASNAVATTGLGIQNGDLSSGTSSIYTQIEIERE